MAILILNMPLKNNGKGKISALKRKSPVDISDVFEYIQFSNIFNYNQTKTISTEEKLKVLTYMFYSNYLEKDDSMSYRTRGTYRLYKFYRIY